MSLRLSLRFCMNTRPGLIIFFPQCLQFKEGLLSKLIVLDCGKGYFLLFPSADNYQLIFMLDSN